jgi:hypothetical protein
MIVKVQISLFSTEEGPQMLIYNKDKSVWYEDAAPDTLMMVMGSSNKKYFYAEIVDTKIQLGRPAKAQNW